MPAAQLNANRAVHGRLIRWMAEAAKGLHEQFTGNEHADDIVQAAACAAPILAAHTTNIEVPLHWLSCQLKPWEQQALELATASLPGCLFPPLPFIPPPAHLYDAFLQHYRKTSRKRHGVYFTPPEVAHYIVNEIDALLKTDFQLLSGLAHKSAIRTGTPAGIPVTPAGIPVTPAGIPAQSTIALLDPACGTGVFLLAALHYLHGRVPDWNAFVSDLLQRLIGIEILPVAAFLAKLNITLFLASTGHDFQPADRLQILTADALDPNLQFAIRNLQSPLPNPHSPIRNPPFIPVLLGNPPFSSLTTNTNPWIANLVRGNDEIHGYAKANGQSLGERKTWLHDDYVKFIRLAQWHIEQADGGIVAFVTNHGYLDNATFRLMRHELLRIFPHIKIVDLHGSRKKYERSPTGAKDENIFGLDQGTAIGLFSKPTPQARGSSEGNERSILEHADLWGHRQHKLAALQSNQLQFASLHTAAPDWLLVPKQSKASPQPEYDSAWSLAEAMPVSTPAPVTARDHFVVAFTREELESRIAVFRDLSIPDVEIRARYFQRTRSARYQTGDTRGWKLTDARRTLAAEPNWQRFITRCLYRPYDWRYVFWHPAMIDWPRTAVTRHLINHASAERGARSAEQGNACSALRAPSSALCLVARRQQLPTQPCTFFWIADGLALDGVIRSDNRGSESLFPLYVIGTLRVPSANFTPPFIQDFIAAIRLTWTSPGNGDLNHSFGPDDLLAYIYALFHAPTYRERYADHLRRDFPRVILPHSAQQFAEMSLRGRQLIDLHLQRPQQLNAAPQVQPSTPYLVRSAQYSGSSVHHTNTSGPQSPTFDLQLAQDFRVGTYNVLRKWLQPKHRTPADPQYPEIVHALAETQRLMQQIDQIFCKTG